MKEVLLILILFCTPFIVTGIGNFGEFRYFYEGALAMGAPELKYQFTGTMIKSNIIIQMKTPTRGIAQMKNITLLTFNKEQNFEQSICSSLDRAKLSPIGEYKEKFEKTFAVNLDPKAKVKMLVDKDEEEFITNIRKSVIDAIINRKNPNDTKISRFTKEEENMFGKCPVHFTAVKDAPKSFTSTMESNFLDKFNSSHHITSKLRDGNPRESAHFVNGIIDFDRCKDQVVVQRSNIGNLTKSTQEMFNSILSRMSTQQEFSLFENETIPIMFASRKTGHSLFNPFGFQTEKFSVLTCQIFLGLGPFPIKVPLRLPAKTKEIKTGLFQVASSFPPSQNPKPWINYYNHKVNQYPISELFMTGIKVSPKIIVTAMTKLPQLINEAVDCLLEDWSSELNSEINTEIDQCLSHVKEATKLVKILPFNGANEMYLSHMKMESKISVRQQLNRELLIDIFAAAGTTSTTKILLKFFSNNKVPLAKEASIWITMANHLESPEVVNDIVNFIINQNTSNSNSILLSSTRIVSVVTIVNRLCVDPNVREYSVERDLYGSKACNKEDALRILVWYLKTNIMATMDKMKMPYLVQALSNLASPKDTFDFFEGIINKEIPLAREDRVRTLAVYALEKKKIGEAMREKAFSLLMSTFYDTAETEEVRQSSFITMLTWEPESFWWQRMAKHTWKDPSDQVAAFVYSSMKSLSESTSLMLMKQSNIASFVLPLAKPASAAISKSYNLVLGSYLYQEKIDTRFHFEWLPYPYLPDPREIYAHLSTSFGGVDFNLFEVAFSQYDLPKRNPEETKDFPGISPDMLNGIKKIIAQITGNKKWKRDSTANLLLRAFDNLYAFLPLKYPIRFNITTSDGEDQIMKNGEHLAKYFIPSSSEMAIPTEIGLPIVFETSSSFLGYLNYRNITEHCTEPGPRNHCYQIPFDLRVFTKVSSEIRSFLPWSNETIKVGVENIKNLHLPLNLTYTQKNKGIGILRAITITPILNKKFSIMSSKNIPYTAIENMLPVEGEQIKSKKILNILDNPLNMGALNLTSNVTDLNIFLNYESDVALPFSSANFIELIKKPERILTWLASPTLKHYDYSLDFDPTLSKTKYIRVIYSKDIFYEDDGSEVLMKNQEGSSKVPVNPLKRITLKSVENRNNNTNSSGRNKILELNLDFLKSYEDTHSAYMFNGFASSLEYNFEKSINGTQKFNLEFFCAQISLYKNRSDIIVNGPYRLNYQTNVSVINDYDSFSGFLHNTSGTTYEGSLSLIKNGFHDMRNLLTYKGTYKMSESQRARLLEDLNDKCVLRDSFLVDLNSILTYDEANLTVNYYLENFNTKALNFSHQLKDWVIGLYYPYYSSTRLAVENKEGLVEVSAKRMPNAEDYAVHIKMPKEQILISSFKFPFGLNKFISPINSNDFLPSPKLINSEYCEIRKNSIKRYDGLDIKFPISHCPVLLSIDYKEPMNWVLLGHLNEKGQLQLILISSHVIDVLITKDEIKVNGSVVKRRSYPIFIKDFSGQPILKIYPYGSAVDFLDRLYIEIKDSVLRIYPNSGMVGDLAGVCGNYYGSTNIGMLGPQGCIYNHDKLLGASWTVMINNNKCLKEDWLIELIKKNENFSQTCAKN